jgi:hypothetical protein
VSDELRTGDVSGRRRQVTGFVDRRSGGWRELADPDGPPSGRQLRWLNRLGMLELVAPHQAEPLTKAEAAGAIDDAGEEHDR